MAAFTTETGVLSVEVEEGRDALTQRLGERGLRVLAPIGDGGGREIRIGLDGAAPYDEIRDAVADLGLPLVRMTQSRHSLEALFRDQDPGEEAAAATGSTR
jgi:ABC-2 type transport system ATP-binding protein